MLTLSGVRAEGFALAPLADMATPTIKFSGNGDTEAVAPLERFLKELHENLLREKAEQIDVDLCDLYFMNSSCIKTVMSWIHQVKNAGTPYRVSLMMNPRLSWQRRSLQPLQRLAPNVVVLQDKHDT